MSEKPGLRSAVIVATKFSYREIVSIASLSVSFWLASVPLLTLGSALIALFDTVDSIPDMTETDRSRPRSFFSSVRRYFWIGIPLSVTLIATWMITGLYFWISITNRSLFFAIGGICGLYISLGVVFVSFRVSNVIATTGSGLRVAVVESIESIQKNYSFAVLHLFLMTTLLFLSVVLPGALLVVFPGFLTVLEILMYREVVPHENPKYQDHLERLP